MAVSIWGGAEDWHHEGNLPGACERAGLDFCELGGEAQDDAKALEDLGRELDAQIDWYEKLDKKNYSPLGYGPVRLDAQPALAVQGDDRLADRDPADPQLLGDDLDDAFDDADLKSAAPAAAETPAGAAETRATVSAHLGPRAFMRLSLGAAELNLPSEELIAEAIEEYLDARGVDSLGGEEFLKKLAAARSRSGDA